MLGKQKCKILKEIRQRIADENDIPYVTKECTHQGNCAGTCPRCESELRYLEQQLALRASLGKRVAVAALCAGMALGSAGCTGTRKAAPAAEDLGGAVPYEDPGPETTPEVFVTTGEVAWPEDPENPDLPPEALVTTGDVAWPEDPDLPPEPTPVPLPSDYELSGMIAYDPGDANG